MQFEAAATNVGEQGLLDERFARRVVGESGTVGIEVSRGLKGMPVVRPDDYPGPFAQLAQGIFLQHLLQGNDIPLAVWDGVSRIANEMLPQWFGGAVGGPTCRWTEPGTQSARQSPT
jgi:hypothetical protein